MSSPQENHTRSNRFLAERSFPYETVSFKSRRPFDARQEKNAGKRPENGSQHSWLFAKRPWRGRARCENDEKRWLFYSKFDVGWLIITRPLWWTISFSAVSERFWPNSQSRRGWSGVGASDGSEGDNIVWRPAAVWPCPAWAATQILSAEIREAESFWDFY